ncbi:MAG TPA: thiamine-phosphate synthase family protein [Methanomicrobiales archaeon]|nr:thiamine-phosphate synthase family protein [Methanomicrobiales archaeon]
MGRMEEEVKDRLGAAVRLLAGEMSPALIPSAGAEIGYALVGARGPGDVATIRERIVKKGGGVHIPGDIAFGAGVEVARIVITAMRTDPGIRSAAVIRFSPAILAVIEDLLLETCSFDRTKEPPGVSTMDWGVAFCCRDGVPDAVYDRGAPGKEGLVRLFGEEPVHVARTIISISGRLRGSQEEDRSPHHP